ncbi:hypothetical protein OW763_02390 [Clostridium aestuarii]|uniref:Rhoptry protein n=1 Tax=Clostridium aestuarii TaxID=338193 RepID=A0ABT4CZG9_9CLOT|nr:hypothetical protein [Clostridium aestuarii]MCY6483203.1 hypothetical protein [Clostridium aestuarii]
MAGILNINSTHNANSKRIHKKLSFELGEKFTARITDLDSLTNEAILKLLDGWQFSAQIKEPIDFVPHKLLKFEVEGYEDGKIVIKIVNDETEKVSENLLKTTLEEQGIYTDKEDYTVLEKMIKCKMPLTRENISKIKSLLEFQNKIIIDSNEEDSFILKYLDNKDIDINSPKGQNVEKSLKGFFSEFKKLSADELFTMLENDIELTENNIKSFSKIIKEPMTIYKGITELDKQIFQNKIANTEPNTINKAEQRNEFDNKMQNIVKESEQVNIENSNLKGNSIVKNNNYVKNIYNTNELKELSGKEILKKLLDTDFDNNEVSKQQNVENLDNINDKKIINTNDTKNIIKKENIDNVEKEVASGKENINNDEKKMEIKKHLEINKTISEKLDTSSKVKEQLDNKINEMKEVIKQAIEENSNQKSETFSKVAQVLHNKINDFKVFNSISNEYYYMDVPINMNEQEYPCKLIIKDERKRGKKIDSKNIKFVASVKTVNMGEVDAYIKVLDKSINVDMKCEKKWMRVLEVGKNKIAKILNNMGYITTVEISEKVEDVNLVECRDFFEDSEFTNINYMV